MSISKILKEIPAPKISSHDFLCSSKELMKINQRQLSYRQVGDIVDIGQGCVFVGSPNQILVSYGFSTCAPFVMYCGKDKKMVLAHIDARSKPADIITEVKKHFAPKEIEKAQYIYYEGDHPDKTMRKFATDTIKNALSMLGRKGDFRGIISSDEKIILNRNGVEIKDF